MNISRDLTTGDAESDGDGDEGSEMFDARMAAAT